VGLTITLFNSIEHGIFAMVGISLGILLFRVFRTHGSFLGKVNIRTVPYGRDVGSSKPITDGTTSPGNVRSIFLPVDKSDVYNPEVRPERPGPGIFIYRFAEGFNFSNASQSLEYMVQTIMAQTKPTVSARYTKRGDYPWNDPAPKGTTDEDVIDERPTLKAIILDFAAVNNLDLTSIQFLIDVRNQLERYAAPHPVQWHFAAIQNRWAKRALAAAGFGFPSFETEDGSPQHFKPIYSLAEMETTEENIVMEKKATTGKGKTPQVPGVIDDIELGDFASKNDIVSSSKLEHGDLDKVTTKEQAARYAALHGINRPYFHPDVQSALMSVMAAEEARSKEDDESPDDIMTERMEVHMDHGKSR